MATTEPVYLSRMGRVAYRDALNLMQRVADARRRDEIGDTLLLVEHDPVVTIGYGGGAEDLRVPHALLRRLGIGVVETDRGGRATYHGPGQLVAYPILRVHDHDLHGYLWRLEQVVIEMLTDWEIHGRREERNPGVWVGHDKIAAVGIAVRNGVTTHGVSVNVDPDMSHFDLIVPCGLADRAVTSMRMALKEPVHMPSVEARFVAAFEQVFGRPVTPRLEPGPWLVVRAPQDDTTNVEALVGDLDLNTVCQEAACPNIGDCWAEGTATFMLLGSVCTRHCRFCNVSTGRPGHPDPSEPSHVAEAAARLGLSHVVITSVCRDDLVDGGAGQFAATVSAVRERCPGATIEVLVPDFGGSTSALETVAEARPDLFNHNVETVERLSDRVRAKADYRRSLNVLAWAKNRGLATKSGLMLGLGETCSEVIATMRDLRRAGCDILTIGQYLQPTPHQLEVVDHVHPVVFSWYREVAEELGFREVAAGPLVRSSYHAGEVWARCN